MLASPRAAHPAELSRLFEPEPNSESPRAAKMVSRNVQPTPEADALLEQRQTAAVAQRVLERLERTLSASGLLLDDDDEPQQPRRRPDHNSSQPSTASTSSAASTPTRRPFRAAKARLEAEAATQEASPPVENSELNSELDRFWRIMSRRRLSFAEAAALRSADTVARRKAALGVTQAAAEGGEFVEAHTNNRVEGEAKREEKREARREEPFTEEADRNIFGMCGRIPRNASRACGRSMAMALFEETSAKFEGWELGDRFEEYSRMLDEVDFGEPLPVMASPWRATYSNTLADSDLY